MTRPYVISHATASVDGRLTIGPGILLLHGDSRWQAAAGEGSGVYERLMAEYGPEALLEGSGSLVREGTEPEPLPPVKGDVPALYDDYLPETVVDVPGRHWFTVVDGRGRVRGWLRQWPGEEWSGWHALVLVCLQTPAEYLAYLQREGIPYIVAGEGRVDLAAALEKMRAELGVRRVISTAGGLLSGALVRAGLVDEFDLDLFPAIIGGIHTPSLFDSPDLGPGEWATRLRLVSAEALENGHVHLRYEVLR